MTPTGSALLLIATAALASCGSKGADQPVAAHHTAAALLSPAKPRALKLDVRAVENGKGATISGETNLPDGTKLMVDLQRGPVLAGDSVTVSDGHFQIDLTPERDGLTPPGQYDVAVSTPLGDLQQPSVKQQLGSNYEALTGPLLQHGPFGRIIQYDGKVKLGGAANPIADHQARKLAWRDHEEFAARSCASGPDTIERMTGHAVASDRRARMVRDCLRDMKQSRNELAREGLIEK